MGICVLAERDATEGNQSTFNRPNPCHTRLAFLYSPDLGKKPRADQFNASLGSSPALLILRRDSSLI